MSEKNSTDLRWYLGDFATGEVFTDSPVPAAKGGTASVTLASEGTADIVVSLRDLTEWQANNWKEYFHPVSKMLVLVDLSVSALNTGAILWAGFINKVGAGVGEGTIRVQGIEVGEYLKERVAIEHTGSELLSNPISTITLAAGTTRGLTIAALRRTFDDSWIPSGEPGIPQCFEIPATPIGSGHKIRILRTDGRTYHDILGELQDTYDTEYIFKPKFTDESRQWLKFHAQIGEPLVGGESMGIALAEQGARFSSYDSDYDSAQLYSRVYLQSKKGNPETKSGADLVTAAVSRTKFPILLERFETLENETTETVLRAQLALRQSHAGALAYGGEFTVEEHYNPYVWSQAVGRFVNVGGVTGTISAGFTGEFRVMGVTFTPGYGTVQVLLAPKGVKYPRVPSIGLPAAIKWSQGNDFDGNSPPLRSPLNRDNWNGNNGSTDGNGGDPGGGGGWTPQPDPVEDVVWGGGDLPPYIINYGSRYIGTDSNTAGGFVAAHKTIADAIYNGLPIKIYEIQKGQDGLLEKVETYEFRAELSVLQSIFSEFDFHETMAEHYHTASVSTGRINVVGGYLYATIKLLISFGSGGNDNIVRIGVINLGEVNSQNYSPSPSGLTPEGQSGTGYDIQTGTGIKTEQIHPLEVARESIYFARFGGDYYDTIQKYSKVGTQWVKEEGALPAPPDALPTFPAVRASGENLVARMRNSFYYAPSGSLTFTQIPTPDGVSNVGQGSMGGLDIMGLTPIYISPGLIQIHTATGWLSSRFEDPATSGEFEFSYVPREIVAEEYGNSVHYFAAWGGGVNHQYGLTVNPSSFGA